MKKLTTILIAASVVALVPLAATAWPTVFLRSRSTTGAYSMSEATGAASAWQFDSTNPGHTGPLATFERDGAVRSQVAQDGALLAGNVATASLRSTCSNGEIAYDTTKATPVMCRSNVWAPIPAKVCGSGYTLKTTGGVWECGLDNNTTYTATPNRGLLLESGGFGLMTCTQGYHLRASSTAGEWFCSDTASKANALYTDPTECPTGQVVRDISASGTLSCIADSDVVKALSCGAGAVARWSGSAWGCSTAPLSDTNSTYQATAPITLTGGEYFGLAACGDGESYVWDSKAADWICEPSAGQYQGYCSPTVGVLAAHACTTVTCAATGLGTDHYILATMNEASDELLLAAAWPTANTLNLRFCSNRLDGSSTSKSVLVGWTANVKDRP